MSNTPEYLAIFIVAIICTTLVFVLAVVIITKALIGLCRALAAIDEGHEHASDPDFEPGEIPPTGNPGLGIPGQPLHLHLDQQAIYAIAAAVVARLRLNIFKPGRN